MTTPAGPVAGAEVAQLYLRYPEGYDEPDLVLRGFAKTRVLAAGEAQTLPFSLPPRALSVWSEAKGGWEAAVGTFTLRVGTGSDNLALLSELVVTASSSAPRPEERRLR